MRLLLVEDDPMVGDATRKGLIDAGFSVDWVRDGRAAELALEANQYAATVLDLGLPKQDGMVVLNGLRHAQNLLPVIVVTARDQVADRVAGLNAGADDYLVKPFDLDELIARIRALIRRHAGRAQRMIQYGTLEFDTERRELRLGGNLVALSSRELSLVEILLEKPGAVLSREMLEDRLFGWGEEPASNALEVHLHNLRRKLGAERIRNVRGVGYKVMP